MPGTLTEEKKAGSMGQQGQQQERHAVYTRRHVPLFLVGVVGDAASSPMVS
jgi:hypothetical protein